MENTCKTIQPLITGYVDAELSEQEYQLVHEHLASCPACSGLYQQEKAVKSAIKEKIRQATAPVHLRRRIRTQIADSAASSPGFLSALLQVFSAYKLKSAFALAVLLLFAGLPYLALNQPTSDRHSAEVEWVVMEGSAVCIDCELLKQKNHDGHHPHPGAHRTALRTRDGLIWSFLQTEKGIELITNEDVLNKKIRVQGYRLKDQKYIKVEGFEVI